MCKYWIYYKAIGIADGDEIENILYVLYEHSYTTQYIDLDYYLLICGQ